MIEGRQLHANAPVQAVVQERCHRNATVLPAPAKHCYCERLGVRWPRTHISEQGIRHIAQLSSEAGVVAHFLHNHRVGANVLDGDLPVTLDIVVEAPGHTLMRLGRGAAGDRPTHKTKT